MGERFKHCTCASKMNSLAFACVLARLWHYKLSGVPPHVCCTAEQSARLARPCWTL
jgi:hypothetical protein